MANITRLGDFIPTGKIQIIQEDNELLVDSRQVAGRLGLDHGDWMHNCVKKYKTAVESKFGLIRLINAPVTNSVGAVNQVKYALLNENQCLFLLMCSRNKPEVIEVKLDVIQKFSEARDRIKQLENQSTITVNVDVPVNLEAALVQRLAFKASQTTSLDGFTNLLRLAADIKDLIS